MYTRFSRYFLCHMKMPINLICVEFIACQCGSSLQLCSLQLCIKEHVSELKADANDIYMKFSTIMLKFSECHSLYDSTVHNTSTIQKLGLCIPVHVVYSCELFFSFFSFQIGQAIKNFFCLFDKYFSGVGRTLKMHILEDHMLEWATT